MITKYLNDMSGGIYSNFGRAIRMMKSLARKSKLQLSSEVVLESFKSIVAVSFYKDV